MWAFSSSSGLLAPVAIIFDGRITHGPFGVLTEVLNKVGWSFGLPPMVLDRSGHAHNLLLVPWKFLRHLLEDAWLCYVGSTLTRASMSSLRDIDGYVVKWRNSALIGTLIAVRFAIGRFHGCMDSRQV